MNNKSRLFYILCGMLLGGVSVAAPPTLAFDVRGLKDAPLKNVQERLAVTLQNAGTLDAPKILWLYRKAPQQIQKALQPFGYFYSTIDASSLTKKGSHWTAHYTISEGPKIKYETIVIKFTGAGANTPEIQSLTAHFQIKPGDDFNAPSLEKAKNQLLADVFAQGYIKARFTKDILEVNLVSDEVLLKLTVDTEQRYFFGPITFSKTPFNEKFLKRFLTFKPGQPFSSEALTASQKNLAAGGYFNSLSVYPQMKATKNQTIPVDVNLHMKKRRWYQLGFGYGTTEGMHVLMGANWRYINAWGHSISTDLNWSTVQKNLEFQYRIPASHPATDAYVINTGYYTFLPKYGKSYLTKLGGGYVWQRGFWQYQTNLNYQIERFTSNGSPYQTSHALVPSVSVNWMNTDNPIYVEQGTKINTTFSGTDRSLKISNITFVQMRGEIKTIQTLLKDNRFVLDFQGGYTIVQNANDLPLSMRFYTGGQNSIRGYPDQSIGPGRYMTVGTAEYQRRIKGEFYGTVFYDIGNAFNTTANYRKNLIKFQGVGAVYRSPIGDIEVYVGQAVSRPGHPLRVGFMIGPEL